MELQNALQSAAGSPEIGAPLLGFGLRTLLLLLVPFSPHIASELWERAGFGGAIDDQQFPSYDSAALVRNEVEIVVQVNGKIRSRLVIAADAPQEEATKLVLADEKVKQALGGKQPRKVIYVPNKLVNIVV
jgi:leucyl-tRNA synthetase